VRMIRDLEKAYKEHTIPRYRPILHSFHTATTSLLRHRNIFYTSSPPKTQFQFNSASSNMHPTGTITNMSLALLALLSLPFSATAVPLESRQVEARQIDPGCTISCGLYNYCLITNLSDRVKCGEGTLEIETKDQSMALLKCPPPSALCNFSLLTVRQNPPDANARLLPTSRSTKSKARAIGTLLAKVPTESGDGGGDRAQGRNKKITCWQGQLTVV
jgi:hypothetical protein